MLNPQGEHGEVMTSETHRMVRRHELFAQEIGYISAKYSTHLETFFKPIEKELKEKDIRLI